MIKTINKIKIFSKKYYGYFIYFLSEAAFASSTGESMPWDGPLQKIQNALSGTTAHAIIIIAIIISALGFAIGESGGLMRKGMAIIFAGSIAAEAARFCTAIGLAGALI